MLFILVVTIIALLFCRNSMLEVVDCMRAGLKKKNGGSRGSQPPLRGGLGEPPPFANVLAFPPRTLKKRLRSINSSNNNKNIIKRIKNKSKCEK